MGEFTPVDVITIAFSVIAAVFSLITYRKSIVHDRQQATLDAYNQLQEQALDHLNYYMPAQIGEIAKDPRSAAGSVGPSGRQGEPPTEIGSGDFRCGASY